MRIALVYTTSDLTPWKENVNINTLLFIQRHIPPGIQSEILIFEGFTEKMLNKLLQFDLIFNLCYGYGIADQAEVALWFEKNNIQHTASSAKSMIAAQNKALLPMICGNSGLKTPRIYSQICELENEELYIAKPRTGACHRDIMIEKGSWFHDKEFLLNNDFIIQPYIYGREFSVAVIPSIDSNSLEVLYPVEIIQESENKIYVAGQQYGKTKREFLPSLTLKQQTDLTQAALTMHQAMGLTGLSRTDFRMEDTGNIHVLDVNAMPNMDPKLSLMPAICDFHGIKMHDLVQRIIKTATQASNKPVDIDTLL